VKCQTAGSGGAGAIFVATIQGMRAMAKLHSNRKALEQVAKLALSALVNFFCLF